MIEGIVEGGELIVIVGKSINFLSSVCKDNSTLIGRHHLLRLVEWGPTQCHFYYTDPDQTFNLNRSGSQILSHTHNLIEQNLVVKSKSFK